MRFLRLTAALLQVRCILLILMICWQTKTYTGAARLVFDLSQLGNELFKSRTQAVCAVSSTLRMHPRMSNHDRESTVQLLDSHNNGDRYLQKFVIPLVVLAVTVDLGQEHPVQSEVAHILSGYVILKNQQDSHEH